MIPLPLVMVAPTGARRTKADHPALPLAIPEIVAAARACHAAGAGGIHAHVRDAEGGHVLDAGLYRELLAALASEVPAIHVQVTTEAAGRYSPAEQRRLVEELRPASVSVALREIASGGEDGARRLFGFCREAGIALQHILHDAMEVDALAALVARGTVPREGLQVLHVLGRYTPGQVSRPDDLAAPLARQKASGLDPDWAVCAFGLHETDCLVAAHALGGKVRVGFENNLLNADGSLARDNAERVREVVAALSCVDRPAGQGAVR
jgi:3-keto-5-aminohexanoate cleavage enzyme